MHTLSLLPNWPDMDGESLLWLASYPRSGNTFTRILLANYFAAGEQPYDINQLSDFLPSDSNSVLWQRYLASSPPPMTPEAIWKSRPDFFQHYRRTRDRNSFPGLKTHTANLMAYGTKGFDLRANDRVLYIVRHPLDVLLSYSDFIGHDLDRTTDEMCASGAYSHTSATGSLEVRGSWLEHASSWLKSSIPCPILLVQYEALRADPERSLRSILAFLGAQVLEERVAKAVRASSFDRLREQEAANRFYEASKRSTSGTFFRKGASLQWLKELTPEQANRLADGCLPIMEQVGYAHPREVFFDGRNAFKPLSQAS
jgi:hypothetical protein